MTANDRQVVMIGGGSRGLGQALVADFLGRGHIVATFSRSSTPFIQACARVMLAHKSGSIISISSVNALRGHRGVAVYSATKAALDGLTRSLARELGPGGIRVNSVAPGYFPSALAASLSEEQSQRIVRRTPLGRLATPEDVVGAVRFLAGAESRFITGQTLVVDGGFTC